MLIWNESNAIRQHKALNEGKKVVEMVQNTQEVRNDLNAKLIHFSGTATANSKIYDNIFGIGSGSENFLKIKRDVQMYQWEQSSSTETKKNTGGSTDKTTTYSYSKQWKSYHISSSQFKITNGHENPSSMLYDPDDFVASNITVGAYSLSDAVVSKINWYKPFPEALSLNSILDATAKSTATVKDYQGAQVFYFGTGAPNSPQIGDTMVDFDVVSSQTISVVAMQTGSGLSKYTGKSGGAFLLVESGTVDAMTMFENAHRNEKFIAWIIRFVGFLGMWLAFYLIMQPLSVAADVIPIVGNLLEKGFTWISGFLAFVFTGIVIGLAWLAFRPILSVCILLGLVGITFLVVWLVNKNKKKGQNDRSMPDANEVVKVLDDDKVVEVPESDVRVMEEP